VAVSVEVQPELDQRAVGLKETINRVDEVPSGSPGAVLDAAHLRLTDVHVISNGLLRDLLCLTHPA
jgi:hypothetical protein